MTAISSVIRLALLVLIFSSSQSHGHEVSLAELSGEKIDQQWFRYVNGRFGLAVDIPTKGYRYDVPINGSGLSLISDDEQVTITIYTHYVSPWIVDPSYDVANVEASIKYYFDHLVAGTKAKGGTVTYSVIKKQYYVVSGNSGDNTYYERGTISPQCPHIFNSVRIFSPTSKERELDKLVTRLSRSLRATCKE